MPLVALLVLATGCATSDAPPGGDDRRPPVVRSQESYYAIIESIEPPAAAEHGESLASDGGYSIRLRFDDRTFETVRQASLDGLRVGDSVRIERNRVRRY